jgi:hypothetical protein
MYKQTRKLNLILNLKIVRNVSSLKFAQTCENFGIIRLTSRTFNVTMANDIDISYREEMV